MHLSRPPTRLRFCGENILLNAIEEKVTIIRAGPSDQVGTCEFF